jgi:anti-anti-sigma factor
MELSTSDHGEVTVVEPSGAMTRRAASAFEQSMFDLLANGRERLAVDFSKVGAIASDGIRVLMLLSQRLEACGGGLVLYALSEDVLRVFEAAGLQERFRVAASQSDAISQLSAGRAEGPAATRSKLTRLAGHLLDSASSSGAAASGEPSRLTRQVAELLTTRH